MRIVLISALVVALAGISAPSASAAADSCGWSGSVDPLIAKADRRVTRMDFTPDVVSAYGKGAQVSAISRLEVDLAAPTVGEVRPTDAAGLTSNAVMYRLTVTTTGGADEIAPVALRFTGLCYRSASFQPRSWVGTVGFEEPAIDAPRALRLAEKFRRAHADRFPRENPLAGMQLMQATTRPPDFGKLRWFVDYEVAPGVKQTLAVYMNGTVKVAVP